MLLCVGHLAIRQVADTEMQPYICTKTRLTEVIIFIAQQENHLVPHSATAYTIPIP